MILGCTNQAGRRLPQRGPQRVPAGRHARSRCPEPPSNRLCGSGLEAVNQAGRAVGADEGDLFVAGGVEMMTRAPLVMPKGSRRLRPRRRQGLRQRARLALSRTRAWVNCTRSSAWARPRKTWPKSTPSSREQQDAFGLRSHRNAVAAQQGGRLDDEIIPVAVPQRRGDPVIHDRDEGPAAGHQPGTTGRPEARLRQERHGDRGQLVAAFRRRRGA